MLRKPEARFAQTTLCFVVNLSKANELYIRMTGIDQSKFNDIESAAGTIRYYQPHLFSIIIQSNLLISAISQELYYPTIAKDL